MKVVEFIEMYKAKKIANTAAVGEWIRKTLEVKAYVPFIEKRELCEKVLNACNKFEDSGLVKVDSVKRYILFTIFILSKYTNLEFSSGEDGVDSIDEYDMLCQNDLLNPTLDVIGAEYTSCNNLLNMMMADIVANNNTIENVLAGVVRKINSALDMLTGMAADKIDDIDLDQINIDTDKINEVKGLIETFTKK